MDELKCTECSTEDEAFAWKPWFKWKAGVFRQSVMLPRQWLERKWSSKNTWVNILDQSLLQEQVQSAIIKIMSEAMGSMIECFSSATLEVMTRLSCSAAGGSLDECFGGSSEIPLGNMTAFSGMKTDFKTSGANVEISDSTVDIETDVQKIVVSSIPSEALTDTNVGDIAKIDGARRLGSGGNCKQ